MHSPILGRSAFPLVPPDGQRDRRARPPVSRLLRSNLTVAAGTTLSRVDGPAPRRRPHLRPRPDRTDRRLQPGERDAEHRLRAAARWRPVGHARAAVRHLRRGRRRAGHQRRPERVGPADAGAHRDRRRRRAADLPGVRDPRRSRRRPRRVPHRRHHAWRGSS